MSHWTPGATQAEKPLGQRFQRRTAESKQLAHLAATLRGEVRGGQIAAPGLGHSPQDRSLSVRIEPTAPGGLLVHSFAGDDPLAAKDYVLQLLGSPSDLAGPAFDAPEIRRSSKSAMRLWDEARSPWGTPVEIYLERRHIGLPEEAAEAALRWHPAMPFAGSRVGCMVALVRNILSNAPQAIHRTAITSDGRKDTIGGLSRLTLGPIRHGAIKLCPDESVSTCIGVGEGIESVLSLQRLAEFGRSPVWSLINAGGISGFPILPGIECVWIAVDFDKAGVLAARQAAARWRAVGREAWTVKPVHPGTDLNDVLAGRAG